MKLADAFVNIIGDDSQLGGMFQSAQQKTNSFVGGVTSQLGTLATGAVVAGVGAVVAGVVGIGIAAFDTSSQFRDANNMMQTQLGLTEERATELGDVVKSVYGNNFGDSIGDAAEAVGLVNQQLNKTGEMSDAEIGKATENAFALRDAYDIDVQESLLAAQNLMEKFGLSSDEAFSFIVGGMQDGLNASGDFLESINEYSVQFADGGADAGQFFAVMQTGLQAGMLGTDKAADLFKEFRLRIQDGSDGTRDALLAIGLDADEMGAQMADGSLEAIDAMQMVKNALANTEDENVRFNAGVALMGSQFEDLGETAVLGLEFIDTALEDVAGNTESLNQQYDNWPAMWEGIKRQGQLALLPLGDTLLDLGERIMPIVQDGLAWFETKLVPIIDTAAEKVGEFIDALFGGLEEGQTPLDAFKDALATIIPPELMAEIEPIIDGIGEIIGNVKTFVSDHSEEFKGALTAIGAVLAGAGIASAIMGIVAAIAAIFSPIGLVIALIAILGAAWAGNWGGIREKTESAIQFVKDLISKGFEAIEKFWDEHGDTILEAAETAWEAIKSAIDTALAVLDEIWQAFKSAFEGDWRAFGENLRDAWDLAWNAITEFLGTVWGDLIKPKLDELINNAINIFKNTDWKQLGANIIDGLINGLAEGLSRVVSKMTEIGQAAWDAWNGFWDASSPAKRAMEGASYVTSGIEVQWDKDETSVAQAAASLGNAAYGSLFGGAGALGGTAVAGAGGGGGTVYQFDFSGAVIGSQRQLEQWIQTALNKTGRRADQIRRTRG